MQPNQKGHTLRELLTGIGLIALFAVGMTIAFPHNEAHSFTTVRGISTTQGAVPAGSVPGNPVLVGFSDGTNVQNGVNGSAANMQAGVSYGVVQNKQVQVSRAGMWSRVTTTTAGGTADVQLAAPGSGKFNVLDSFCASISNGAAAQSTPMTCSVIQDQGGTPVTLWAFTLGGPTNGSAGYCLPPGASIPMTVANKTLDCVCGAGAANTVTTCAMAGYTTN